MTIIQAQVTSQLLEQLESIAREESVSLEYLVERALAVQVETWMAREQVAKRSRRGSWEHFQQVLARVAEAEPEAFDRL